MLDINNFKHINDTYGHNVGDDAIRETGKLLLDELHSDAKVFRFGGDEFLVIMLVNDEAQLLEKIKRIHAKTEAFNDSRKNSYHLTFSIGFSIFDFDCDTYDSFLERMDKAMYIEKEKWKLSRSAEESLIKKESL